MDIQTRVKELRRVPASSLIPNPANFRRHGPAQRQAMQAMLTDIGFAGAELVYETDAGLVLIDSHLRAEAAGDAIIPVLVTDLSPEEALLVLATYDPLGAMAATDESMHADLRARVGSLDEDVDQLLDDLDDQRRKQLEDNLEGTAYGEEVEATIVWLECPDCSHRWPR